MNLNKMPGDSIPTPDHIKEEVEQNKALAELLPELAGIAEAVPPYDLSGQDAAQLRDRIEAIRTKLKTLGYSSSTDLELAGALADLHGAAMMRAEIARGDSSGFNGDNMEPHARNWDRARKVLAAWVEDRKRLLDGAF